MKAKIITLGISSIEHAGYAFLMQLVGYFVSGSWWYGALFASGFFLSREITQHEYRLFVFGQHPTIKPWAGFVTGWTTDSVLDCVIPCLLVCLVATIF